MRNKYRVGAFYLVLFATILLVAFISTVYGVVNNDNVVLHDAPYIVQTGNSDVSELGKEALQSLGVPYKLVAIGQYKNVFIAQFVTADGILYQLAFVYDNDQWSLDQFRCIYNCPGEKF